jgi:hypothetical protein
LVWLVASFLFAWSGRVCLGAGEDGGKAARSRLLPAQLAHKGSQGAGSLALDFGCGSPRLVTHPMSSADASSPHFVSATTRNTGAISADDGSTTRYWARARSRIKGARSVESQGDCLQLSRMVAASPEGRGAVRRSFYGGDQRGELPHSVCIRKDMSHIVEHGTDTRSDSRCKNTGRSLTVSPPRTIKTGTAYAQRHNCLPS